MGLNTLSSETVYIWSNREEDICETFASPVKGYWIVFQDEKFPTANIISSLILLKKKKKVSRLCCGC